MTNPNTQDHTDAFYVNWANGFSSMGVDPMFPMKACMHESECRAQAWNKVSNTVGLIQFSPETLKFLGFQGGYQGMLMLTADQQIPWVLKFYKPIAPYIKSAALAYTAIYLPSLVKEASESPLGDDFVLAQDAQHGGKLSWAYNANPGFDHPLPGETAKKGYITVGDMQQTIDTSAKGARWNEIQARLQNAIDGKTPLVPPQKVSATTPSANLPPLPSPTQNQSQPLASLTPDRSMFTIPAIGLGVALIGLWFGYHSYKHSKRIVERETL